ncbi:MAG: hypothetical protein LKH74_11655 [Levilactobacillus sp.]|jgi:hypothetical protein|uniref:hypothetical protein n=1 Tax=Levilactobacillus sp. TaxID=2767919 RepID=UPI00258C9F97|nr:hypothetical protein [Levilactobacillus sp.]MCH4124150.1 hypothetical protein [Levilactobacillus sp.]MCI1554565.1 hypothetical protein [Levilactobacillus sp.]MCI1598406.1 hypothetical protein [Levilactobacillus sp.]
MQKLPFSLLDSWAFWSTPDATTVAGQDPQTVEARFGEVYQPNYFPTSALSKDLAQQLATTKYVIVGLNRGNAEVDRDPQAPFLSFHGPKRSMDYRLAAALYDTEMWGAFMTDLDATINSDSTAVQPGKAQVEALEQHLADLGIPQTAKLIALGNVVFDTLSKSATRRVFKLSHYSGANGHWQADAERQAVQAAIEG